MTESSLTVLYCLIKQFECLSVLHEREFDGIWLFTCAHRWHMYSNGYGSHGKEGYVMCNMAEIFHCNFLIILYIA
jgi:hypothetical protein